MDDNDTRNRVAPGASLGDSPQARGGPNRGDPAVDPGIKGREVLEDAKQKVSSLSREAKEQGKDALSRQKEGAAEQLGSVAAALHTAADELEHRDQAKAGRFVSYAAEQLESFGRRIRDKDIDSLIDEASRMGRRSPGTFFVGSLVVGFLVSRFLKSSQAAREREFGLGGDRASRPLASSHGAAGSDWGEGVTGPTISGTGYSPPVTSTSTLDATRVTARDSVVQDGGRYE